MNTPTTLILIGALTVGLAGCESASPGARPGPYVKPGLVMVPADQAHFYGLGSPNAADGGSDATPYAATDIRSVQTDATVSAIQFNRYADPARPDELMHEAHVVYRRDAAPRWRLRPASAEQQILVGPSLTDGRGEVRPLASQELDTFVRDQRVLVQRQQQALGQLSEGMRQLAQQQQQLAKELAKTRAERPNPAAPSTSDAPPDKPAGESRPDAPTSAP